MWRRRLVVPLVLVLSGLGWAAAHTLVHRTVMPAADGQQASGFQSYLSYLPTSLALCLALAFPLAVGVTFGRHRGTSRRSLWLFGVVPVLGFAGHALVEPLVLGTGTPAGLAGKLAPVLLVGLLAQLPFALVAVHLARGVLVLARRLARSLERPGAILRRERERHVLLRGVHTPALRLGRVYGQRAPPALPVV